MPAFRYICLLSMLFAACTTDNPGPVCCPDPDPEEVWESYVAGAGLASSIIHDLILDERSQLWAATQKGLSLRDDDAWRLMGPDQGLVANQAIWGLTLFEDSLYLVSDVGLFVKQGDFTAISLNGLIQDSLTAVYGNEDRLLVGNNSGELAYQKPGESWKTLTIPFPAGTPQADQSIQAIYDDATNRNLWVATANAGLWVLPAIQGNQWDLVYDAAPVRDLIGMPNNRTVLATAGEGMIRFFDRNLELQLRSTDGLLSDQMRSLFVDSRNRLWIGTNRGVNVISGLDTNDPLFINFYDRNDGLIDDRVNCLLIRGETNWWFGTQGGVTRRFFQ